MSETFQLFRLVLTPRRQIDLLDVHSGFTREQYLKSVFTEERKFKRRKSEFHYIPEDKALPDGAIVGKLGKPVRREENLPPDQGFKEVTHDAWKAVVIAIDPTNHEDGQKASVQIDAQVGNPLVLLPEFVKAINESYPGAPFLIQAEPLFDQGDFWDFAHENSGQVTCVTFEFVTPNGPWGTANDVKNGMKEYQNILNAAKVTQTFQNKDGLDLDNDLIRASVDYAESGQGTIKAKAKKKKKYNSTDSRKTVTIKSEPEGDEEVVDIVFRLFKKVLGRN
ncbi:hypothetical protein [Asticcacaulis excentricus]|uniref:hypothetical protein n=1 Tax=Asticcacaulis excentricus TaxID=78587 RepID=UPI000F82BC21|nr:hypothetical protein [Asticcacaulis excentricus]